MGELEGQVAIVTGGASGIGEASAKALAEAGAAVAILDRDVDGSARVAAEIASRGQSAVSFHVDLSDTASIANVVDRVVATCGGIDILVNAAAITAATDTLLETSEKSWDLVHTVNLKAPLLLMQAVARHMIDRRNSPLAYASAKAALVQLTRSAAAELGSYDINVNAVAPGITSTGMTRGMSEDELQKATVEGPLANLLQRVSQPPDVAAAVLFLCLPGSRQITAQVLHTSAGAVV
jgi:NAD(P)-dependent dehydrogenase (short-subunit alcohol dehydrogenase family)